MGVTPCIYTVATDGVTLVPAFMQTGAGVQLATCATETGDPTDTALLVTPDGELNAGNAALKALLEADGWTVLVQSEDAPEMYDGIAVVVLDIQNDAADYERWMHPPIGVVAIDSYRLIGMVDAIGWTATSGDVTVADPSHPIADGTSGDVTPYDASTYLTWAPDVGGGHIVVHRAGEPTQAVIFVFEAGEQMHARVATSRHVGIGYHNAGFEVGLAADAQAHVLAAVRWASESGYQAPPPPGVPTGLTVWSGAATAILSWQAVTASTGYEITRSPDQTAGSWASVGQTNDTTWTDTDVEVGDTWYYSVRAFNAVGNSDWHQAVSVVITEAAPAGSFAHLFSESELAECQQRAANGPFRVRGDFSTWSPDHWTQMQWAMDQSPFTHTPHDGQQRSTRWNGPNNLGSNGQVRHLNDGGGYTNDPIWEVRRQAHDMMSAAYAAAITDNHAVAQAIVAEMEWQATRPNLDFSNRTRWRFNYYNDLNPLFMLAVWAKDYLLAYDVTKAMGYTSATVENWFLNLAELQEQILHANLSNPSPGRKNNDYSDRTSWIRNNGLGWQQSSVTAYFANGSAVPAKPAIMGWYNNRRSQQAGYIGLVGVILNNTFYVEEFKRYAREWLMFGNRRIATDGAFADHMRGSNRFPQQGFSYALHAMESLVPAMDALARQGDTSLYEFSSSDGANPSDPNAGGTNQHKTMEDVFDNIIRWVAGTWPAQYTPGSPGNAHNRIQSRSTQTQREMINDAMLLLPANYYGRQDWYNAIMRIGTPTGFTQNFNAQGSIHGRSREDWRHRFLRSMTANNYPGGG